jgi:hypothetical protein
MFFQLSRCYRVVERFIISFVHTMVQNQKFPQKVSTFCGEEKGM